MQQMQLTNHNVLQREVYNIYMQSNQLYYLSLIIHILKIYLSVIFIVSYFQINCANLYTGWLIIYCCLICCVNIKYLNNTQAQNIDYHECNNIIKKYFGIFIELIAIIWSLCGISLLKNNENKNGQCTSIAILIAFLITIDIFTSFILCVIYVSLQSKCFIRCCIMRLLRSPRIILSLTISQNNSISNAIRMENLPICEYTKETFCTITVCPICQCDYEHKEKVRELDCKHVFHVKCIDEWLSLHATCPLCRKNVFTLYDEERGYMQVQPVI